MKPNSEPIVWDVRQAAKALGLSPRSLQRRCKSREIPHRRLGRKLLFSPDALREWARGVDADSEPDGDAGQGSHN